MDIAGKTRENRWYELVESRKNDEIDENICTISVKEKRKCGKFKENLVVVIGGDLRECRVNEEYVTFEGCGEGKN